MPSLQKFSAKRGVYPGAVVKLQAGDVASAFRNVCTHSQRVFLFGGRLELDNALVIDMSAAFGWSGSPATYRVVGGAIAILHSASVNRYQPDGMFNHYWVDDHINVAADLGTNCQDAEKCHDDDFRARRGQRRQVQRVGHASAGARAHFRHGCWYNLDATGQGYQGHSVRRCRLPLLRSEPHIVSLAPRSWQLAFGLSVLSCSVFTCKSASFVVGNVFR